MTITTNLQALIGADNLNAAQARLNKSLARLSSGSKIISPGDDAAGLAASTQLDATIQRTQAAQSNVANALSFTQTQDGYLGKIATALSRMSELSVLALDETKSDNDRQLYDKEFQQLNSYIVATAGKDFNGVSLFSTSSVGITLDANDALSLSMAGINLTTGAYGAVDATNIATTVAAGAAMDAVNLAINQLSTDRASLGSYQARLNYSADQLAVGNQNLTAANSAIKDVDVANESTEYARENILVQSATAMLAQANQLPATVLKLITG